MAENKETDKSSAQFNIDSDLEGKLIIDSNGQEIGKCKAINIGDDGQIGLIFETLINGKSVVPVKTIPYSAISKITDVIALKVPINIKVAQSIDEIKKTEEMTDIELHIADGNKRELIEENGKLVEEIIKEVIEPESAIKTIKEDNETKIPNEIIKTSTQLNEDLPVKTAEKLIGLATQTIKSDATLQLSKTLDEGEEENESDKELDAIDAIKANYSLPEIQEIMIGLDNSVKKLDRLFKLLSGGNATEKIEAIKALTSLTKISPELGLSLIPKMMKLNDEPQQNVRLAIAQQLEYIGEINPNLFKGYFLEILENTYEEPIEEIREHLVKALHNIAIRIPESIINGLEDFLEEVIIGKRVPEVPSKVLHDATLKVVSGNFHLTRIAISVRLKLIAKGGKLAARCVEELEDYNATLIGLTIIENFAFDEAEKLLKDTTFKKLGGIFLEFIQQMLDAYKEGSFNLLEEVVDKKIEIPTTVLEKFFEIRINKTLEGVKNVPLEVFKENSIVSEEEAEQIIYRLVVQKRVNAAITMNNGRTFITAFDNDDINGKQVKETPLEKPKTVPKNGSPKKTVTPSKPKTTKTGKSTSSSTKTTAKKQSTTTKTTTSGTKKQTETKKD
ncbi:MAG: hypothetical protein JXA54_05655 [Candidatus Heimdallarchaeota archaeon]|nr:hypothetical protein [Candidatus Heimdallarchaeota archaeon]